MEENVKLAIEEYQCPGCIVGHNTDCFESARTGEGCGKHMSGTVIIPIGNIFLGMPKGFNRLGHHEKMIPHIYKSFETFDWGDYDEYNIPVWKHLNENGHTFVRGLTPRLNIPFIHIFLENCMDKINCYEVTNEDINGMD